MVKASAEAGRLDSVVAEDAGWLEDEDIVLSSVLLSGGVRGGVGNPFEDDDDDNDDDEGSLLALLRDGFLSCICCFCCTASSCLRSVSHTHRKNNNESFYLLVFPFLVLIYLHVLLSCVFYLSLCIFIYYNCSH